VLRRASDTSQGALTSSRRYKDAETLSREFDI